MLSVVQREVPGAYFFTSMTVGAPMSRFTLVSRNNFSHLTPLLDEVAAGDLEPAHICIPLRKLLRYVTVLSAESKRSTLGLGGDDLLRNHQE